jgi:hypothetical protein
MESTGADVPGSAKGPVATDAERVTIPAPSNKTIKAVESALGSRPCAARLLDGRLDHVREEHFRFLQVEEHSVQSV